jgi:heptosyltransferase-3
MRRGIKTNRLLDFYVGIPLLNLSALGRQAAAPPATIERIGLMANPALGDTLLLSGPLQDLRAAFPRQKLIFFATALNLGAARLLPAVDHIEAVSLTRPFQAIARMRAAKLDLLVDFTAWQRLTAFVTLYSGTRYTVGFRTAGQHRHRGYSQSVEHRADRHELDNLRALVASIGVRTGAQPRLVLPELPVPNLLGNGDHTVVFHPWASGGNRSLREWPQARWIELAHALHPGKRNLGVSCGPPLAEPDTRFVITGSPADEPRARVLREELARERLPADIFIGRDGLGSIARLLRQARLLVSVNTGIMHLGAILGTPTVSLNGPTAQHRWGPVGPRSAGVNTPDGSGGFLDLGFEFAGHAVDSMHKIGVRHVLGAIAMVSPALAAAD